MVIGIVKDRLQEPDTAKGFLMDGFPRTIPQAEALDKALEGLDRAITKVIVLLVDEELILKRLTGRRVCRKCQTPFHVYFNKPKKEGVCDKCGGELYQRDDDTEATVQNRLEVYRKQTEPLIDYYDRGRRGGARRWSPRSRSHLRGHRRRPRAGRSVASAEGAGKNSRCSDHKEVAGGDREDGPSGRGGPGVSGPSGTRSEAGCHDRGAGQVGREFIRSKGGVPTFKGYRGFPGSICASPNDMVVHGIPGRVRLREGDILGVDVGVTMEGYIADAAATFPVGEISEEARELLRVTEESLWKGIAQCQIGNRVGDISHAVQTHAEAHGYSVVESMVGHGVGREMHEDPQVPNFGPPGRGPSCARAWSWPSSPWSTWAAARWRWVTTPGPSTPRTGACPPISSTRWPSPRTAPAAYRG